MADSAQSFGIKRHDHSGSATDQAVDQAMTAASDAVEMVSDTAKQAYDTVEKFVVERPFTVAVGALAIGWLLGRFRSVRRAY